jgi:hypothetical protein
LHSSSEVFVSAETFAAFIGKRIPAASPLVARVHLFVEGSCAGTEQRRHGARVISMLI